MTLSPKDLEGYRAEEAFRPPTGTTFHKTEFSGEPGGLYVFLGWAATTVGLEMVFAQEADSRYAFNVNSHRFYHASMADTVLARFPAMQAHFRDDMRARLKLKGVTWP